MGEQDQEPQDRDDDLRRFARALTEPVRVLAEPVRRVVTRMRGADEAAIPVQPGGSTHQWIVDCGVYVDGRRLPGAFGYPEALDTARSKGGFLWLGLREPNAVDFAPIAKTFGLHELAAAHAVTTAHRPKIERYGDVSMFVLRSTQYTEHPVLTESSEVVETGEVLTFIGDHFVITVRHGAPGALGPVRADLEKRPDLLRLGQWAVAHAVCDRLVDSYLEVAAGVEADIERLEEHVFAAEPQSRISQIYQLKRELTEFKRAVAPLQRPMAALLEDRDLMPKGIRRYFRDVNDNLLRTVERVTGFEELLNSILQARLAQVSVDQNNDMRKIASWAAIAAVQTAIAGIYGMNFAYIPGLQWRYGYPAALALMLVCSVVLYRRFRRSGWL